MSRTDRTVEALLDACLLAAAGLTAAYLLVLLAELPAAVFYPVSAATVAVPAWVLRSRWRGRIWDGWGSRPGLALLFLCFASASVNLFWGRPDADDFSFFHRALVQLDHLGEPFLRNDTAHELPGLPPISPFHLTTALEPCVALLAHAAGVPVLQALQNGVGVIALFVLPLVYFLLMRFHRFSGPLSVAGAVFVAGFLALSGDTHRDWGNFTLMRAWQGKCILVGVVVPASYLYLSRFLIAGRAGDFARLNAACLVGIGCSGSGLFLLPFSCGLVIGGFLISGRAGRRHTARLLTGAVPILYSVIFAGMVKAGLLPVVADTFVWSEGWPDAPVPVLQAVYPGPGSAGLAAVLTLLGGFLAPRRRLGLMVLSSAALGTILMLLPATFKLLMAVVKAGAMWRLTYATPIPLAAGLAGAGAIRLALAARRRVTRWAWVLLLAGVAVAAMGVKTPALDRRWLTPPGTLKFHPELLRIARGILGIVRPPAVVLAPEGVVVVVGLLEPRMKFTAARLAETVHAFRNAGRREEGELRADAQRWLLRRKREAAGMGRVVHLVRGGVDAVVATDAGPAENARLLAVLESTSPGVAGWETYDLSGMILFCRRGGVRPAKGPGRPFI